MKYIKSCKYNALQVLMFVYRWKYWSWRSIWWTSVYDWENSGKSTMRWEGSQWTRLQRIQPIVLIVHCLLFFLTHPIWNCPVWMRSHWTHPDSNHFDWTRPDPNLPEPALNDPQSSINQAVASRMQYVFTDAVRFGPLTCIFSEVIVFITKFRY